MKNEVLSEIKEKEIKKSKKPILRPLIVQCFYQPTFGDECGKTFEIKYNLTTGEHVWKNNWGYWTEKASDKDKYICNDCLILLYNENKYYYWENITNTKKRNILRVYVKNSERHRKIMPCDNKGCEPLCCYGCRCCEEKSKIIVELKKQLKKKSK